MIIRKLKNDDHNSAIILLASFIYLEYHRYEAN